MEEVQHCMIRHPISLSTLYQPSQTRRDSVNYMSNSRWTATIPNSSPQYVLAATEASGNALTRQLWLPNRFQDYACC